MDFRRSAAVLLALILALSGMLHAWCAPMAATAGGLVAVCTPHGVQWVPADGPDAPARPTHDCPACQAGHCGATLLPPDAVAVLLRIAAPQPAGRPPISASHHSTAFQLPPARGPPPFG